MTERRRRCVYCQVPLTILGEHPQPACVPLLMAGYWRPSLPPPGRTSGGG
jgi:hypothetical protein